MKDGKNRKRILNNALNNFTEVLFDRPDKKPNYYAVVKTGHYYDVSVIDTDNKKEFFEVVDWREVDETEYNRMIKNMEREGGQFLITDKSGQPSFLLLRSSHFIVIQDNKKSNSLAGLFEQMKNRE